MDLSSKPPLMCTGRGESRRGIALPSILFALLVIGILGATIFVITDVHARSSVNRERTTRAVHLAESGAAHALALVRNNLRDTTLTRLLRGFDGVKASADDGLFTGYGLSSGLQIPAAGVSTAAGVYSVRLLDDPAEVDNDPLTDRNSRVLAICRGVTTDGATAEVNAIIGNTSLPGFAVNGNVTISGATTVNGRCGRVHANGTLDNHVPLTAETGASSSGSTNGTIKNTYGETLPKEQNVEPIEFPDITAAQYCGSADYLIRSNGTAVNLSTGSVLAPALLGWYGGPLTWEVKSNVVEGTYCVENNVKISESFGTAANPKRLSIIAKGSMEIGGNPFIRSARPDGLLWIMDGDLKLNGNSVATADNFNGSVFAGSQCEMSGTVRIHGQVVCADKPNPPGSEGWASANKISGTTTITFGCGGLLGEVWRLIAWYPTIGS